MFCIYCDEASTTGGRFMLIGGVWIAKTEVPSVLADFTDYRNRNFLHAEMKWGKISKKYLDKYQGYVDIFFDTPSLSFNCIVIDKHIINYARYHNGDPELGFYKFYYLIISRRINYDQRYLLHTDHLNTRTKNRLETLKDVVNNWCSQKYGTRPLRRVTPCDSKDEELIQLSDVLLGAIAFSYNNPGTSQAKTDLASYIAAKMGLSNLKYETPSRSISKINIWYWRPN